MALPVVTFEGNLVNAPELRFTPNGDAVASFRVAANKQKRQPDGTWASDRTTFMKVTCWRQVAENVAESLNVGDSVVVVGALEQEEWEDKEGASRTSYQINAFNVAVSLRFATVKIERVRRESFQSKPEPQKAAAEAWGLDDDKPPF